MAARTIPVPIEGSPSTIGRWFALVDTDRRLLLRTAKGNFIQPSQFTCRSRYCPRSSNAEHPRFCRSLGLPKIDEPLFDPDDLDQVRSTCDRIDLSREEGVDQFAEDSTLASVEVFWGLGHHQKRFLKVTESVGEGLGGCPK
jgi:hypothetical protein